MDIQAVEFGENLVFILLRISICVMFLAATYSRGGCFDVVGLLLSELSRVKVSFLSIVVISIIRFARDAGLTRGVDALHVRASTTRNST